MKSLLLSCVISTVVLATSSALLFGQTGPTGTWRLDGLGPPFPWEAVLRADGSTLLGAVSLSSTSLGAEIYDGVIDGRAIVFTFDDGGRSVTLHGTVEGDIHFTWESKQRAGLHDADPDHRIFGDKAPRRFTAMRVPDAADGVAAIAARALRPPTVTFDRILHADREPQNWLTNSRTVDGRRASPLTLLTPQNVAKLQMAWLWQGDAGPGPFEATPLVVDGVLYTVNANNIVALNAATGRVLWTYSYTPKGFRSGYRTNRGLAMLGGTLFMGTLDAHLVAINAYNGKPLWNVTVADSADPSCGNTPCYSITHAPLVVEGKVIVGTGGGEGKVRGFIAAFDASTGKEAWRFHTIPGPGEPGHEMWPGDSWKTGGGPVWNTGTYDPELNLTYWGIGNPGPANKPDTDLLYTESVVALDADTGRLRWHYQFTPHDDVDWDATQVPVLVDLAWQGRPRTAILFANRNGLFYVLDRATGEFLMGKPFVEVNWMSGFDGNGRPMRTNRGPLNLGQEFSPKGTLKPGPGEVGATNWYPPSYNAETGLLYVAAHEYRASPRYSAIRALDPLTGERRWEFRREGGIFRSGTLTTASGLVFAGLLGQYPAGTALNGEFVALDASTGQLLWRFMLPGSVQSGLMTYAVDGKQYVAVAAGNTLFAFALRD